MSPDEYCQNRAAQSGSSFYYSFLFLPLEKRRAITALYAFCREVDDVVDETQDAAVAAKTLDWWRQEIRALERGTPTHPVTRALQPHLARFGLRIEYLLSIIEGMAMDLQQSRYLDFAGLRHYCWHVAGVVGVLSAHIFGVTQPETVQFAEKLGLAFQMTNILRDVGEDARKGRIYLPIEDLQRFQVPASDLLNARHSPAFAALMQFEYERTQAIYDEALQLLPATDRKAQRTSLIMAKIYRTLLDEIRLDGFRVLDHRIKLTPVRKLWLAWITYVRTR